MNNEDFEAMLIYALNECRADLDIWHQLCTAQVQPEEIIELRNDIDSEEELAHKLELFAPMTDRARNDTLGVLLDRYYRPSTPSGPSDDPTAVAVLSPPTTGSALAIAPREGSAAAVALQPEPANRSEGKPRWLFTMMALAAAVLLALFLVRPHDGDEREAMPGFQLELRDSDRGTIRSTGARRSNARCGTRYRIDQELSVFLRPMQPLYEELAVAASARREGESARWLMLAPPSQGARGRVTIEQPLADLALLPGTWTLTFYVTRKGQRYDPGALRKLAPGTHPGVAVVESALCIIE